MVLTRRDMVRAGLLAAGAAAVGASGRAAGRFKLGLVTYNVAKEWDLDTTLRLCREAGFEGVEFRTTHAHGVERSLSPDERQVVRRKCRDAGLLQTSLGTVCEFHAADPAVVRKNVDDCREWVLLARDIGARGVKVRPNGLPKGVPEERTLEQIGRALAECGAFARDHGVEIWVEVHGDQTKIPARMRKIMDVCSHPAVGITWNSNDTDVEDGSVARSFALLRPDIRCCHVTDLRSGYPYRELFALLAGSGFTGFTLCEFPEPVPASNGATWLRDYRERWEGLQRG
jgi:sugar phosphate isomerase/epimerase